MSRLTYALKHDFHLPEEECVKWVICDNSHLDTVKQYAKQLSCTPLVMTLDEATDALAHSDKEFVFDVKDVKRHIPLIQFTSGSTGIPKGVLIPDCTIRCYGEKFLFDKPMSSEAKGPLLLPSAFYWVSGFAIIIHSIFHGFPVIMTDFERPSEHLELIQKHKVTSLFLIYLRVSSYAKDPNLPNKGLPSLKNVWITGGVAGPKMREVFVKNVLKRRNGVQVVYGMTEIGTVTTWEDRDPLDCSKAYSCGYLRPGVQCKVNSNEGNELGPGNVGQLWFKSPSQFAGYWGRPELKNDVIEDDGFFKTGDIGYVDHEGFLYVLGRGESHILRKSLEITSKVEDCLRGHEDILEAVALNSKDGKLAAFVVMKPDCDLLEKRLTLDDEVNTLLTGGIHCIDKIPITPSRKVDIRLLQSLIV